MKAPHFSLPKSSLTFPVSIFILSAIFFIAYYFYYIPVNKDHLHKNGFLILENIKKSIAERNAGLQIMYKDYLTRLAGKDIQKNIANLQRRLDSNNIEASAIIYKNPSSLSKSFTTSDLYVNDAGAGRVVLKDITEGNLVYTLNNSNTGTIGIANSFKSLVEPILQPQKKELFELYMACNTSGLIYSDAGIAIGKNVFTDTLFPDHKTASAASIKDVTIKDIGYKMFSSPASLGNEEIVICGFIKTKDYNTRLHEIPVSFIYPIVIIFILLIIFLPIIKFYIMGVDEHVKFIDIALGALSFFVGAPLITLTLIQVLMLWSGDIRAKENLDLLSAQIDSSFRQEVNNAYRQLDTLDNVIGRLDPKFLKRYKSEGHLNVSDPLMKYLLANKTDTSLYYNFNRVAWIDRSGEQRIKAQFTGTAPSFINVSDRKYFKTLQDRRGYMLPGHPQATFAFEPVKSWTDGEFTIVISKPSVLDTGYVTSLSTRMYSVTESILPPGFGFCIIDDSGQVQVHSEFNRSLSENIVEKISPSREIKEAIASRQDNYFKEVKLYGKTTALKIEPISKTPFYIITFYDKGYIVPINMRVFMFALLFCFVTFLVCLLMWFLVFYDRYYSYPMLYSPMAYLRWAIPRQGASSFYASGWRLLLIYLIIVFSIFAISYFNLSDYDILAIVLLFPVNVISGLYLFTISSHKHSKFYTSKRSIAYRPAKALFVINLQLFLTYIFYTYSDYKEYGIGFQFMFVQILFNILMWLNYFFPKIFHTVLSKFNGDYLSEFSRLASLLIVSLAVLPAGIFTWYAHNQEITQSIKKGQLYLAESLVKKDIPIKKFMSKKDTFNLPGNYQQKQLYYSGIYKIYNDSIITNPSEFAGTFKSNNYEKFYFDIANTIGNNYYDPLLLPALKENIKDNAWYWVRNKIDTTISFWYNLNKNSIPDTGNVTLPNKGIKIVSKYPERYKYVDISVRGIFLVLFIVFLLRGLFWLLRSLTERIFLKKYILIAEKNRSSENKIITLFKEYELNDRKYDKLKSEIEQLKNEYNVYIPGGIKAEIYDQEKHMINTIAKVKGFYEYIWLKCARNERYMLLDFAKDGLANYKNTAVIYSLLDMGIFIIHEEEIKLFSVSFRAYLLTKKDTPEFNELHKSFRKNSIWQSFRRPLIILLLGIALFIFFTQEQTFQKILALVAGLTSISSILVKFFVDAGSNETAKTK